MRKLAMNFDWKIYIFFVQKNNFFVDQRTPCFLGGFQGFEKGLYWNLMWVLMLIFNLLRRERGTKRRTKVSDDSLNGTFLENKN